MAMAWSMTKAYSNPVDYPSTYLTNALLPVFICILSAYFVAELWGQVDTPKSSCVAMSHPRHAGLMKAQKCISFHRAGSAWYAGQAKCSRVHSPT